MTEIVPTPTFLKNAKKLAKRYHSFRDDLEKLINEISKNPNQGVALADGFRKIRMSISSKSKGKSAGARVIFLNVYEPPSKNVIYLVTIYDKSDMENITISEIREAFS